MSRFGRAKWRPRQIPGQMNKTEARFETEILLPAKEAGEILDWKYDAVKFRVGSKRCWYSVDFMLFLGDGHIELVDVKGGAGWEDDALVKIKAAAMTYPGFIWAGWTYIKKNWTRSEF